MELKPDAFAPLRSLFRPQADGVHTVATKPAANLLAYLSLAQLMKTWLIKRFGHS